MTSPASIATDPASIETWAGEMRVNLVRLASLIAFYGYHLANLYASPNEPGIGGAYHFQVTALVMVWAIGVLVLYFQLAPGSMPPMLKFAVVLWDLTLTTTLLVLSGGPRSHLLPILFLIIASAPLRLSLPLIYVATLGSIVSYLIVLGHYVYRVVGVDRYYAEDALRIPRTQEVGIILGLMVAGILAGQVVRQIRHLIDGIGVETIIPDRRGIASTEARRDANWIAGGIVILGVLVMVGLFRSATTSASEAATMPLIVGCVAFAAAVVAGILTFVTRDRTETTGREQP